MSGRLRLGLPRSGCSARLLHCRTAGSLDRDLSPSKSSVVATRISTGARSPAVLFGNGRSTISDALSMNRVMPPRSLTAASSRHVTHVPVPLDVIVDLHISVDVDYHVMTMPVKAAPRIAPSQTNRHAEAKADDTTRNDHSPRMIVVGPVHRPPPRAVNDHRIIHGHVNHLGSSGFDHDLLALRVHDDSLLARCPQVALGLGPLPELLDRCHDLLFLSQESVSQLLRPVEPVVHHLQDRGEVYERFHARVPVLLFQRNREPVATQARVSLCPAGCLDNFHGIGGCHQDLYQKIIRIERDGRNHLVQLFLAEQYLSHRSLDLCHDPPRRCRDQHY